MNQTTNDDGHKQVPIFNEGETVFEVDEGIQSLIQFLYDKGIKTFNSCEDNAGGAIWTEYSLEAWMGSPQWHSTANRMISESLSRERATWNCYFKTMATRADSAA
jgi:cytochrome c2